MSQPVSPIPFQGPPFAILSSLTPLENHVCAHPPTLSSIAPTWVHHVSHKTSSEMVTKNLHVVEHKGCVSVLLLNFSDIINGAGHTLLVIFSTLNLLNSTFSWVSLIWSHSGGLHCWLTLYFWASNY